ncbi:PepSY domain-containing protein [Falsiroseomonas sp.]|uniref:PepSY domain-containing protein n=1 Tax=Falsiroseomonas sp. TaxID=2870721 RepID=UPI003565F81A
MRNVRNTLSATGIAAALLAGTALVAAPAVVQAQGYGERGSQYGSGWGSRGMEDRGRSDYERGFRMGREDERRSRFGSGQYGGQSQGYGQSYGGQGCVVGGIRGGESYNAQRAGDRMGEDRIRERLRERGYSDIENFERNDGRYTADARRYGERVEDLRVDPRTGRVLNQSRLDEDQVRNMLDDRGWSDVGNIERNGNVISAQARRDGRTFDLLMNARTGEVLHRERHLGEDRIRERLRERGYSDIEGLERDGGRYTADAQRYGERVEDLRIDPTTGWVRNQSRLNEEQVRNMLYDRGWSNVGSIERDGNIISAEARRDGRRFDLRLNARTGGVLYRERRDRDRESGSDD